MQCPQCQQTPPDDAAFCGNCGAPLTVGSAEQAGQDGVALAVPAEIVQATRDHGWQAIVGFVIAVIGLVAWVIPVAGLVFGLLAMVFGTIAFHSRRRVFARSGIALSIIVLAASLFMWVHSAQRLAGTADAQNSSARVLQSVKTDCYSTQVPAVMNITISSTDCTFQAADPTTGERYVVKALQISGLSASNLASAAVPDVANVVQSVAGGKLQDEHSALFAGSVAYQAIVGAPDGSGGSLEYVYRPTSVGNLLIISHSVVHLTANSATASVLESNWSWQ